MPPKGWLVLALIVASGIVMRGVAIAASAHGPYAPVDVYTVDKQASRALLNFQNPYDVSYVVQGASTNIFAYLPLVPIYYAPFYMFGDIRYGSIVADVLTIVALYFIARSFEPRAANYAALIYALLPVSIWLTSVSATNIMVGTAFLTVSIALIQQKRFGLGSAVFGLGMASNQLVILLFPIFCLYFWRVSQLRSIAYSLAVSALLILPALILSPAHFLSDVLSFQFSRPFQTNGYFGLYGILYLASGVSLGLAVRAPLFLFSYILSLIAFRKSSGFLLYSSGAALLFGAFLLPVNGFWNYFLPSLAIGSAALPMILFEYLNRATPVRPAVLSSPGN